MSNLLVGVLCEDGIVVGSADSGPGETGRVDPAEEPAASTFVVRKDLIVAGVGRTGLGQRFAQVVASIRSDSRFRDWTSLTVAKMISAEAIDEFASTRADMGHFGALVALAACDGFELCEFSARDLQPEWKTPDRPFASLGAGRSVARPFLRFLQRVFFTDSPPTFAEGVFAATWALDYAIGGSGPGLAAESLKIAVLARETPDVQLTARLLPAGELSDALAHVRAAEKHLAAYRRELRGSSR
ncbi:MAG: hypothetical protein ABIK89_06525 [Planctomycetota bacterium]